MGPTGALADHVDAAMAGKAAPRVWLILHEPGQPELSTAVALAFARELGGRGQALTFAIAARSVSYRRFNSGTSAMASFRTRIRRLTTAPSA